MSVSHLSAPPAAVARFHAALRALRGGPGQDIELALGHLQSAVGAFPGYADAWFEIGRLHLASGSPGDAIGAFQEALRADPWLVSPYEPLILLLEAAGDPAGARQVCAGLRRINPALPEDCGRG